MDVVFAVGELHRAVAVGQHALHDAVGKYCLFLSVALHISDGAVRKLDLLLGVSARFEGRGRQTTQALT